MSALLIQYPRNAAKIDSQNEKKASRWTEKTERARAVSDETLRIASFRLGGQEDIDDDADDLPIAIKGEPLSETIIRERR
ncbi:MAG: hypothetical protein ACHQ01_06555 [Candidatus Limnocylindrales bacterium]